MRILHRDIAARMKQQGIDTLAELARRLDINAVTLSGYIYGDFPMPFRAAVKLARILGNMSLERLSEIYEEILAEKSNEATCAESSKSLTLTPANKY